MITIWLLVAITPKQGVSGLNSLVLKFSLSVCDITATGMIDTCHSHLVANGNSPQKKGLVAQSHWLRGSALVNINGGHFEGYIRKAGLGSVPKIANTFLLFIHSGPSGRNHIYLKGSLSP